MKNRTHYQFSWLAALTLLFIAALTGCAGKAPQPKADEKPAVVSPMDSRPQTLAILPFDNNSVTDPQLYDPLSNGIAAMFITDLSREGTAMKLIERTKIQTLLKEVALGQTGSIDQSTAVQVGRMLGAQSIAFGSFMVLGKTVRIDLRIIKVETGELIMAERVMGSSDNFIELEQDLAQKIAQSLRVAFQPQPVAGESGLDGALYFSQGVEAHDRGDSVTAKSLFEKAIAVDPAYRQKINNIDGL